MSSSLWKIENLPGCNSDDRDNPWTLETWRESTWIKDRRKIGRSFGSMCICNVFQWCQSFSLFVFPSYSKKGSSRRLLSHRFYGRASEEHRFNWKFLLLVRRSQPSVIPNRNARLRNGSKQFWARSSHLVNSSRMFSRMARCSATWWTRSLLDLSQRSILPADNSKWWRISTCSRRRWKNMA